MKRVRTSVDVNCVIGGMPFILYKNTEYQFDDAVAEAVRDAIVRTQGTATVTDLAPAGQLYKALANGATAMGFGTYTVVKVTPTGNATYTTTVPAAGTDVVLMVLTSGSSSYTITFGTGFKTTGTLATGTTTARMYVLRFVSDGTNLYEASRTAAYAA